MGFYLHYKKELDVGWVRKLVRTRKETGEGKDILKIYLKLKLF